MSEQKNQKTRKWWLGRSFLLEGLLLLLEGLLLLLFFVFMSASGDQKIVTAESGQDVTLTCRAPNNNIRVVEWSRADLMTDYVLLYQDGQSNSTHQHPSFKNRVDLQDTQMKDGDVSLILKNVTINDAGTYKCGVFIEESCSWKNISIIYLRVVPPDQKIITAESGQDVTLTCRAPNNNIIVVEWSRADLRGEYVLVYRDGHFVPQVQHPSFKNRVDLQDKQMKDGDVSLILKDVTINDTGTYKCGVVQRVGGPVTLINTTYLHVDPPGQTGGSVGLIVGLIVGPLVRFVGLSVSAVLFVAVVGFLIYRRCKLNPAGPHVAERLQPEYPMIITAESGQDVILTCRAVNNESEKMSQQLHQPEC